MTTSVARTSRHVPPVSSVPGGAPAARRSASSRLVLLVGAIPDDEVLEQDFLTVPCPQPVEPLILGQPAVSLDLGGKGPGRPGWLPTQVPTDPGLHIRAPGSSSRGFATRAIRCRYVDLVQVTMYLPGFASTAHETAPPSLDGVPRVGSPASTVL